MLVCVVGANRSDLTRGITQLISGVELKAGEHQLQGGPFQQHPLAPLSPALLCLRRLLKIK